LNVDPDDGNCTRCPQPNTLSAGEISLQTRCFTVDAFDICVTLNGLLAAGNHSYS
jgi:hypothetical protein